MKKFLFLVILVNFFVCPGHAVEPLNFTSLGIGDDAVVQNIKTLVKPLSVSQWKKIILGEDLTPEELNKLYVPDRARIRQTKLEIYRQSLTDEEKEEERIKIEGIDLSYNSISNFKALVEKNFFDSFPSLKILKITENFLADNEENYKEIACFLKKKSLQYLDITANPLTTISGIGRLSEFFPEVGVTTLEEQITLMKKLIWVRESSIEGLVERFILPSDYAESHRNYYKEMNQRF